MPIICKLVSLLILLAGQLFRKRILVVTFEIGGVIGEERPD